MRAHNWMMTHWKPASAFVYTFICLCDFVIFPAWVGMNRVELVSIIGSIEDFGPNVQQAVIRAATAGYEPFTLKGSGLFHLAFGALLTGAAINKGGTTPGVAYTQEGAMFRRRTSDEVASDGKQPWRDDAGPPPKED